MLSSFEAQCKALWNRFASDLGPVLRRLWDLKSVIKASSMPFDGRYTRSLILRTPHNVLKGFCHCKGIRIEANSVKNLFPNAFGFKTTLIDFEAI